MKEKKALFSTVIIGMHSDVYEPVSFELGIMIITTIHLFWYQSVWLGLQSRPQGNEKVKHSIPVIWQSGALILMKFGMHLWTDIIQYWCNNEHHRILPFDTSFDDPDLLSRGCYCRESFFFFLCCCEILYQSDWNLVCCFNMWMC